MEHTFSRKPWRSPLYYSPTNSAVPVRSVETESPRVVSIPVHFVASARARTAAERIQRIFRGFILRKNVGKIACVAAEADRIDQAISSGETVRRVQEDPKERLKANESLMSLLFQLDSVHGIDPAVRDLRKAVIRKVIALQEAVDSIPLQEIDVIDLDRHGSHGGNNNTQRDRDVNERQKHVDRWCQRGGTTEQILEDEDSKTVDVVVDEGQDQEGPQQACANLLDETTSRDGTFKRIIDDSSAPRGIKEMAECHKDERMVWRCVEGAEEDSTMETIQLIRNTVKAAESERCAQTEGAIKRVIAENKKLRSLIAELCERNVVQSRLMSSLAVRVEQLERAVRQQEMRKAKKKQKAMAARSRTPN